jgi:hypothetical protein
MESRISGYWDALHAYFHKLDKQKILIVMFRFLLLIGVVFSLFSCKTSGVKIDKQNVAGETWEEMFNGENLNGWTPKFAGYQVGENPFNTFRVTDGVIEVNYDGWESFSNQFGHLFYKTSYSSYEMTLEYRFKGDQVPGGPGWAFRNSGIMFHSQDPNTMTKDQDFPICVEFQFLGGNGTDERSTGNLCTPTSHVNINGELVTAHCINSTSPTIHGDDWVKAGLIVYADSIIHHVINGETVMTYSKPIFGGGEIPEDLPFKEGQAITSGYIALQAESHPLEFRNVRIKKLK